MLGKVLRSASRHASHASTFNMPSMSSMSSRLIRCMSTNGEVFTIVVPSMGDSISSGTIAKWNKEVGEQVAVDDIITTLETDKVSVDVRSPHAGVMLQQLAKVNDSLNIGAPLANIKLGAVSAAKPAAAPAAAAAAAAKVEAPKVQAAKVEAPKAAAPAAAPAAPKAAAPAAPVASSAGPASRKESKLPLSPVRIRTAQRLKQVQNTYALLTTFQEIDMSHLISLRKKHGAEYEKKYGTKLSFLSFFVRAAVSALQSRPIVNAVVDGNDIVYRNYFDISVAVAAPAGVITPVIRSAETLSIGEIDQTLSQLAKKAKDNQLAIEDLVGATFAINNSGVDGLMGQGLVSPPASVQLNLHGLQERPIAVGEGKNVTMEVRPMMYASLTYDHRIIDGSDSVLFLKHIKQSIEDTSRIILL